MFGLFFEKLKTVLKNPMVLFIYGLMSKWYIMIMVTAVTVTFLIFKNLKDMGVIDAVEKNISSNLTDVKSVAQNCVPKMFNFGEFWECLKHPPEYNPSEDEKKLEQDLQNLLNFDNYDKNQNKDKIKEVAPDNPYE